MIGPNLGCADRDMLKFTQQEFSGVPQHLQLELLLGTVLCLIGEQLDFNIWVAAS